MIRTRVGYSGGIKQHPTYSDLGDHTETYQVDFDPEIVSYEDLIMVFWASHNPHSAPFSRQYKAVVFYHDAAQERIARNTAQQIVEADGRPVTTEILPVHKFWLAEDYHQKYSLRNTDVLMNEVTRYYDDNSMALVDSTLAARLNAYAGLRGHESVLLSELESYGISESAKEILREVGPQLRSDAIDTCGVVIAIDE